MSALYKREVIIVVHSCGAGTTGRARTARTLLDARRGVISSAQTRLNGVKYVRAVIQFSLSLSLSLLGSPESNSRLRRAVSANQS